MFKLVLQDRQPRGMLLLFVTLYLALTLLIGFLASRRVHTSADFLQAGRRLPPFVNAAALFALWFGSETVFGASGEFIRHGLSGVIEDPFGAFLCLVLFGLFFTRKLYRMNILTIGDLFGRRYGATVERVSSFFMILPFIGFVAAQLVALAIILQSVAGVSFDTGLLLCAGIVTMYTFVGGMWAVSLTDLIQGIVIVAGLITLAVFLAQEGGGLHAVWAQTDRELLRFFPDPEPIPVVNWIAAWFTLGLGSLVSQDVFQRVNSARSEKAAVHSTFLGAGLYLVFAMIPLFIALTASVLHPEMDWSSPDTDTQMLLPDMVMRYTPLPIQVWFFGSILSAMLSTCSGALLAPASILAENIIRPLRGEALTDRAFLRITRLAVVGIGGLAILLARGRANIYELVGQSSILGMVSLLVPMVWALYAGRATASGAMLAMVVGFATWLVFEFGIPLPVPAFLPALGMSLIGMGLGNRLRRAAKA
jgi:SSS family transporter